METVELAEIAEIKLGRQRSPGNHSGDSMRPYLRAANIGWHGLRLDDVKSMNFTENEMSVFRLVPGDILLSEGSGSATEVGKPALWSGELDDCAFQNTLLRVRPTERVDPRYLLHYFAWQASSGAFGRGARGVGIRHLGREALAKWPIPLVELNAQRRLAAILDEAEELRSKHALLRRLLDSLSTSVFSDMFLGRDDATVRLDQLVDHDDRINYGVVQPGDHVDGGVPVIRVSNLSDGRVHRGSLKNIEHEIENKHRRSRIRGNEVLVSSVGSIGKIARVTEADVGSNIVRAISRVPIADDHLRIFVAAFLQTPGPQRYFASELRTVAQPTLNVKQLAATPVPVPPVGLQVEFAARIEQMDTDTRKAQRAEEVSEELVSSLQNRAFRGEL